MFEIKLLDNQMVTTIYHTHMQKDFPQDELKPLDSILSLIGDNLYEGFGLFEDNTLRAYAFLAHAKEDNILLLDYLAVCADVRGQNYGSAFLNLLKNHFQNYQGIIVEIESLESAKNTEELALRTKRLAFYERNGLVQTKVMANCFGVEFSILYLAIAPAWDFDFIHRHLDQIYHNLFPKPLYDNHVFFVN